MENPVVQAAKILRRGGLVAFPTETVYGLGASIWNDAALARIFALKGRPADNPLIVHVANAEQVHEVTQNISPTAYKLMEAFWPGPLTLVLPKRDAVSDLITAGLSTVAVRQPDHPIALELIREAGVPIAAPSANRSGRPSPTQAEHVRLDLKEAVDFLIDGGPTKFGLESTVIDVSTPVPTLLRTGAVSLESIEAVLGQRVHVATHHQEQTPVRSPGQKYSHYQPRALVVIIPHTRAANELQQLSEWIQKQQALGQSIGLLLTEPHYNVLPVDSRFDVQGGAETVAQKLFTSFREADAQGITLLLMPEVESQGIGRAVMDRVQRAAQATWNPDLQESDYVRK